MFIVPETAFDFALMGAIFIFAGLIKGLIGFGLPAIVLVLLTLTFDLKTAMGLMLIPCFVTNCYQATRGGKGWLIISNLWPFFVTAILTIGIGVWVLNRVDLRLLSGLLGFILIIHGLLGLWGWGLPSSLVRTRWFGPAMGGLNGLLTGMTGTFTVPSIFYLQAFGYPRDLLIQAMGVLFVIFSSILAVALWSVRIITLDIAIISSMGLIPALIGMVLGQRLRGFLSESHFNRFFLLGLLFLGVLIIARTGATII